MLLTQMCASVCILLKCGGKNVYDSMTSLRGENWTPKTSLNLPLFTEVSVPSQES